MKRLITGLLVSLLLMITGCDGTDLAGMQTTNIQGINTGKLVLSMGGGQSTRTVQATKSDIYQIELKVEPASKKDAKTKQVLMSELEAGNADAEFSGLQAGPLKVSATALTDNGTEIGRGETTVKIKQGQTAQANIDLKLVKSEGGSVKATINIIEPGNGDDEDEDTNIKDAAFVHEWTSVTDKESEKFLVARSNVKKYVETWADTGNYYSYWGVNVGNMEGYLTYKYDFNSPVKSAELFVETAAFNQNNYSGTKTGFGSVYVEASADGRNWTDLINSPAPQIATVDYQTYNKRLPKKVIGGTSIWIRARLFSSHLGAGTMYSHGQFGRSQNPRETPVYSIKINH